MPESAPLDTDLTSLVRIDEQLEFDLATLQENETLIVQTVNSVWKISPLVTTNIDDVYITGLDVQSDSIFFTSGEAVVEDDSVVKMPRVVHLGGNLLIYPDGVNDTRYWLSSPITFFEVAGE